MFSNLRNKITVVFLFLFAVFAIGLTVHFLWRGRAIMRPLYEPKMLSLRVGGVSVYPPQARPIQVMTGLPIELTCEVVPPTEEGVKERFHFEGPGAPPDSDQCLATFTLAGEPGTKYSVWVEYQLVGPDGVAKVVERREAQMTLIAAEEFFRIRALETADEKPVPTHTVPQDIVPYVDAALKIEGAAKDYAVLFFVRRANGGSPVAQIVVPPDNPQGYHLNVAPLKEVRSYGGAVGGYAAWPGGHEPGTTGKADPIQVGNAGDRREAFELYAGLFRVGDLEALKKKALTFERVEDGRAIFTVGSLTLAEIRAMAYRGWLSEPLMVVRADQAPSESRTTWEVK